ncbi:MAG: GWxTD domain-containing protein [Candidatus Neomarinimicrobiota bacterium]
MPRSPFTSLLFLIVLLLSASCAQSELFDKKWQAGPEYKIDHIIKPGKDIGNGDLEIRLSIPYDEILFVKNNLSYKGRFEISLMIFEGNERRVNESWIEVLTLNEFRVTNSRKQAVEVRRIYSLPPEKYRLEVQITDLRTQNRRKQVKEIDMLHLKNGKWMLGDLYLVEGRDPEGKSGDIPDVIYIGFTASGISGTYPFTYTLFTGEQPVKHGRFDIELVPQKHEYIFPVRTADLGYNQYLLLMQASIDEEKYERRIPLRIAWTGSSELIPNLGEAIEQMRYLSHTGYFPVRNYRKALNSPSAEQRDFFNEVWDQLDPTPGTERNELMDEYYYRIQVANRRFSGQREGWRSDRGMIYVIYGEPDAVEEHYMEINTKPYIIWYYYSVNRSFIFIDYTGFGDYQLSEPMSNY